MLFANLSTNFLAGEPLNDYRHEVCMKLNKCLYESRDI